MPKAATSRLLKAASWAYTSSRLLATSVKLKQANNTTFNPTMLKGKSMLSQPIPHISMTPNLDYFENKEPFQNQTDASLLKSNPINVPAFTYAPQRVEGLPQIITEGKKSFAKIEQRKMDFDMVVEIIIEAEVSNYNDIHQIYPIGKDNMDCNKTKDKRKITRDAFIKTMLQHFTYMKEIESKVGQVNKKNNKLVLYNPNYSIRMEDLEIKVSEDNKNNNKIQLYKNVQSNKKVPRRNSYRAELKVKTKQHNMDNKIVTETFNVGNLKETYDKFMLQNPSDTKDSISKIEITADSETKAALFNSILFKDAVVESMPNIKDPMKSMPPQKNLVDKTEQLNWGGERAEIGKDFAHVYTTNVPKGSPIKTPPDSYKIESAANSELCNEVLDNKIKTNLEIDEAFDKNMPQNCNISIDPADKVEKAMPIMTFVSLSF